LAQDEALAKKQAEEKARQEAEEKAAATTAAAAAAPSRRASETAAQAKPADAPIAPGSELETEFNDHLKVIEVRSSFYTTNHLVYQNRCS